MAFIPLVASYKDDDFLVRLKYPYNAPTMSDWDLGSNDQYTHKGRLTDDIKPIAEGITASPRYLKFAANLFHCNCS